MMAKVGFNENGTGLVFLTLFALQMHSLSLICYQPMWFKHCVFCGTFGSGFPSFYDAGNNTKKVLNIYFE